MSRGHNRDWTTSSYASSRCDVGQKCPSTTDRRLFCSQLQTQAGGTEGRPRDLELSYDAVALRTGCSIASTTGFSAPASPCCGGSGAFTGAFFVTVLFALVLVSRDGPGDHGVPAQPWGRHGAGG